MKLIITITVDLHEKDDPLETIVDQFMLGQNLQDALENSGYGDAELSIEVHP